MSRGPRAVQRWLLERLPRHGEKPAKSYGLACEYFLTSEPTAAQLSSVRRALRGLRERRLVDSFTTTIRAQGDPAFWAIVHAPTDES